MADRACVGLGHIYAAKEFCKVSPFLGQRSALAPAWQLRSCAQVVSNLGFLPCLAAPLHRGDGAQLAALHELAWELLNHSGSLEKFIRPEKLSLPQQQKPRKSLFAQAVKFNLCRASVQQRAAAFMSCKR